MLGYSLLLPILDLVAIMDAMQYIQIYKLSSILHFIMASMTSKLFAMNRSSSFTLILTFTLMSVC